MKKCKAKFILTIAKIKALNVPDLRSQKPTIRPQQHDKQNLWQKDKTEILHLGT